MLLIPESKNENKRLTTAHDNKTLKFEIHKANLLKWNSHIYIVTNKKVAKLNS